MKLLKEENICIAGGCGMNSVANGKVTKFTPFKKVYIQPAAGDAKLIIKPLIQHGIKLKKIKNLL